jgi:hypothetical protein
MVSINIPVPAQRFWVRILYPRQFRLPVSLRIRDSVGVRLKIKRYFYCPV